MKLLRKYNFFIIILVFLIILYISYNSYTRTKEIIKSKYEAQSHLVEKSVIDDLRSANGAYSISENVLNDEMKYYSRLLLDEYKKNPDINSWNLNKFKSQMNDYDIYIIDSNLKVIKTTFKTDLGLDFSRFNSFSKLLRSRLNGSSFAADKMDISTNTGKIKKYSYMPTPDHKYLLELSINIIDRYSVLKDLNVFALARNLVEKYQSVEDISFYKFNKQASTVGIIKDKKDPINTDIPKYDKNLVREAILSNSIESRIFKNLNFSLTYRYIPFLTKNKEGEYDWWNSYVVGITYNNEAMIDEINKETSAFFIKISIIAVVFMMFIAVMMYLLKKTEYMAYHDHLTGLANRKAFEKYFNSVKEKNSRLAIVYIDLDNFKSINDNYGHRLGDDLLTEVGLRLKNMVRDKDKVSRVGGDEFTILLTDISSRNDAVRVVEKLEDTIRKPFHLDGNIISIDCSIGVSISSGRNSSLEDLINKADISMYQTKNAKC